MLEQYFQKSHYIYGIDRKKLAKLFNVNETQITIWFQNRRMKQKLKEKRENESSSSSSTESTSSSDQCQLNQSAENKISNGEIRENLLQYRNYLFEPSYKPNISEGPTTNYQKLCKQRMHIQIQAKNIYSAQGHQFSDTEVSPANGHKANKVQFNEKIFKNSTEFDFELDKNPTVNGTNYMENTKDANQLREEPKMHQGKVKKRLENRHKLELDMDVPKPKRSTKLFRPFSPEPELQSSDEYATDESPKLVASEQSVQVQLEHEYAKNHQQTHQNSTVSQQCSMIPKKRRSAALFRPFIDNNSNPNPNSKPLEVKSTSNDNLNIISRSIQFDRLKTGKELMQPCEFSAVEFESFLKQNINSKQQNELPNDQLTYISVSYNNNHLMSIPVKV